MLRCGVALGCWLSLFVAMEAATPAEELLGTVVSFSTQEPVGPYRQGYLDHPLRPDPDPEHARKRSRVSVVDDASVKGRVLHVRIYDATLFDDRPLTLLRLSPFYPPEADVLRLWVKVLSGKVRAFVGGPTAYYADSDVFTRNTELAAADDPQWVSLDFSLNHPLRRNYRRAGLSTDAERIYYNRWAQEPVGVFLEQGTEGEFLIDRIEILSRGEGKPFPTFAPDDVQLVRSIADFEVARTKDLFTLYMADGETEWFAESWRRTKPLRFEPSRLRIIDRVEDGRGKVLETVGRFAEEVHCAGIRTSGAGDANALRLDLLHDAPSAQNTLVGRGRSEAVDLLVFVAPPGRPVTWQAFAADDDLRKLPGPGFDYQLSYRAIRDRQDADFAVYQARRYVVPGKWTTLVVPAADFVCIYGSGEYRERFLRNRPLTYDDVTAIAWLTPWSRSGRNGAESGLWLDNLAFVRVPGTAEEHRSFWQLPTNAKLEWRAQPGAYGGTKIMLLPGDVW